MGNLGCCGVDVDFNIEGLDEMLIELGADLAKIELTYPEPNKDLVEKKEEVLKKRHEALVKVDKKDEKLVLSTIKDFNNKELEIDNELIKYKLDKMHEQYELGLKMAQKVKNKLIEKLEQQLEKASSMAKRVLSQQIESIKAMTPAQFLDSEFGKPVKDTLEKKGLSQSVLVSYKDELRNQRTERRKKEREEFGFQQNEWPDDEKFDDDKENLFQKMLDEYKDKMELN